MFLKESFHLKKRIDSRWMLQKQELGISVKSNCQITTNTRIILNGTMGSLILTVKTWFGS